MRTPLKHSKYLDKKHNGFTIGLGPKLTVRSAPDLGEVRDLHRGKSWAMEEGRLAQGPEDVLVISITLQRYEAALLLVLVEGGHNPLGSQSEGQRLRRTEQ